VRPRQEFLGEETAGGILLLLAAIIALAWANVPGDTYADTWNRVAGAEIYGVDLRLTLGRWINDLLMTVFFFVVGLEIKREVVDGELSDRRTVALPVAAALGGMIVPALIFAALNLTGGGGRGWGIPMATDIAFAVGVLALLGTRMPLSLKLFLLALAIVDDIGAIAVIAIFYADDLSLAWLGGAIAVFAMAEVLALLRVRIIAAYLALAAVAWLAVHESGVHAALAAVIMAMLIPTDHSASEGDATVLDRLENILHPWSSYLIVPLFALANAGVDLGGGAVGDAATSRVSVGVIIGLIAGKPIGITLCSLAAVRTGIAQLPRGVRWTHILGAGMIAGIGFTVSIFISELAFTDPALVDEAKIGILAASALAGIAGYVTLRVVSGAAPGGDAASGR
jgi:NhaA family Na+:H+ antiporter